MAHELLVVGGGIRPLQQVLPVLRQVGCHVHRVERADTALELLQGTRFDLVVVRHPLATLSLEGFTAAVRGEGSACRDAGLLVVTDGAAVAEVGPLLKHGVNRIVTADAPCDKMLDAVADLLGVAPRRALRGVVQLELWLTRGITRQLAVTENLSATGMLVCGGQEFPVGSRLRFELLLPGAKAPIVGEVEVARHTDRARERVDGFGGKIVALTGDGESRLRSLLAH